MGTCYICGILTEVKHIHFAISSIITYSRCSYGISFLTWQCMALVTLKLLNMEVKEINNWYTGELVEHNGRFCKIV